MRRFLRFIAITIVSIVLLVIGAGVGAVWYLRTDSGRARLVAYTLRKLKPFFPGGIKLGGIGGNYASGLVLYDVELDDREGQPAVAVKRIELKYRLLPLLAGQVSVQSLDIIGGLLVSRPLADGRDNLGSMVDAPKSEKQSTSKPESPVAVDVETLDIEMRFARLPAHTTLADAPRDLDLHGTLHASASLSRGLSVRVGELRVDLAKPSPTRLDAHGTIDCLEPNFHHVEARVQGDASELRHYAPQLELYGPIVVHASADGPLHDLHTHAEIDLAHHGIALHTNAIVGAHEARIEGVHFTAPFAQLDARGVVHYDGHFEGQTRAKISDLSKLTMFGAPPMSGRATLDATASWKDKVKIEAHASAEELTYATTRLHSLGFEMTSEDLLGHLRARVRGVRTGNVQLYSADVLADSTAAGLALVVDGEGPESTSAHVRMHGKPRLAGQRFLGADATLDELRFSVAGTEWHMLKPARARVDLASEAYELERLDLVSEEQELSLQAKLHGRTIDSSLLEAKHFDFSKTAALLSPGHVLPFSDLYALVQAHGPFDDPVVNVRLSGETHGRGDNDLIHAAGQAEATIEHRRIGAKAFVTIGGQKASASLEAPFPLRPDAPIAATVDASVLLSPLFAELITPKLIQFQPLVMFTLSGRVTAHATLTGTTSHPEIHAAGRFINWEARGSHGGFGLSAEYKDKELSTSVEAEFSSLPAGGGTGGGVIEATAQIPIDLGVVFSGSDRPVLQREAPVHAQLGLRHVGTDYLPFRAFDVVPPLQHGTIDGSVLIAGTMSHPQLTTHFVAKDFDAVVTGLNSIGATVDANIEGAAGRVDAKLSIGGSEATHITGSIDAGRGENPFTANWRDAKLAMVGQSDKFDLARLPLFVGVNGLLFGDVHATGKLGNPTITADFEVPLLNIGDQAFKAFKLHGRLVDQRFVSTFHAEQKSGGALTADVALPLGDGAVEGHLDAHAFHLDLRGDRLPYLRTLRCVLDGKVAMAGSRASPTFRGALDIKDGELGVTATAIRYRDIVLHVDATDSAFKLSNASLHAGNAGEAKLSGTFGYHALRVVSIDLQLAVTKFPYQQQGVGVLLDGELFAKGAQAKDGGLAGRIRIKRGLAQLPDLAQTRVLLPIGPLTDVRVVDDLKKQKAGKHGLTVGALLDGPFVIKGREVSARALGGVSIDLTGQRPLLRGTLRLDKGAWVDLFGRRYDVERGQLTFDGTPQPLLDFRVSRRTTAALIGVNATGRAGAPHLDFWSEPPSFDAPQIVSIILSGDPSATGVSPDSMQRQAIGAISSLLVTSIKQKFLPELPIDVFRIDTTDTSGDSTVGSQIEIGKYLTQSLYVGYAYQVGGNPAGGADRSNRNAALLDYRVAKSWQVEADFGDAGVGGVDLYWTYRP